MIYEFFSVVLFSVVLNHILDRGSDVVYVLGGKSTDGNTAVFGQIDAVFVNHSFRLLDSQSGEGEHTNLSGNVRPVSFHVLFLNGGSKGGSHVVDTVGDGNEFSEPLLTEIDVVQNHACNSGTVLGWGRVVSSDQNFNLGKNSFSIGFIVTNDVHSSGSLTVETHSLGERLANDHLEALVHEVSETVGIFVEATGGETLVGGVEEGEERVLGANFGDSVPLFFSGVNTGGVVGTSVEQDSGSSLGFTEIFNHTFDINSFCFGFEVSIFVGNKTSSGENCVVVSPGGLTDVERCLSEFLEEFTNNAEGTSSGEGLGTDNSSTVDIGVIPTEQDTSGSLVEICKSIDGGVFFIKREIGDDHLFGFADDGEDEGFSVIVSVGTDTEVDLVGVFVVLVASGKTENGICGGHLNLSELTVDCSESLHLLINCSICYL